MFIVEEKVWLQFLHYGRLCMLSWIRLSVFSFEFSGEPFSLSPTHSLVPLLKEMTEII